MVMPGMAMASGGRRTLFYTLHWLPLFLRICSSTGEVSQGTAGTSRKLQLSEKVRRVIEKSNPERGEIYASIAGDETAGRCNFNLNLDKYGPEDVPESFGNVQYAKIHITGAGKQQECTKEKCRISLLVKTVLSLQNADIQSLWIENVQKCKEGLHCPKEASTGRGTHERVMLDVKELRLNRVPPDVCAILLGHVEFGELENLIIVMGAELEAYASLGTLKCKKIENLWVTGASAQQIEDKKQAELKKTTTAIDPENTIQTVEKHHTDSHQENHEEEPTISQPGEWSIPITKCEAQGDVREFDPILLWVEAELNIRHDLWESLKKNTQRDVKAKIIRIEGVIVQELAQQKDPESIEKNMHTKTLELHLSGNKKVSNPNVDKSKNRPEIKGQLAGIMKTLNEMREIETKEKEGDQNTTTAVSWAAVRFGALDLLEIKSQLSNMPLSLPNDGSEQYTEISGRRLKKIRVDYKKKRAETQKQRYRHFSRVELRRSQSQPLLIPQLQCRFSASDSDLTSDKYRYTDLDSDSRGYSQQRGWGVSEGDNKTEKGQREITARI